MSSRSVIPVPGNVGAMGIAGYGKSASGNQELQPNAFTDGWIGCGVFPTQLAGNYNYIQTMIPKGIVSAYLLEFTMAGDVTVVTPGACRFTLTFQVNGGVITSSPASYVPAVAFWSGTPNLISVQMGIVNGYVRIQIYSYIALLQGTYTVRAFTGAGISGYDMAKFQGWTAGTTGISLGGVTPANVGTNYFAGIYCYNSATVLGASSFGTAAAPQLLQVNGAEQTAGLMLNLAQGFC